MLDKEHKQLATSVLNSIYMVIVIYIHIFHS